MGWQLLSVCTEEQEKAFYPGVTQSFPSKPLYLSDHGFMFSRAVILQEFAHFIF